MGSDAPFANFDTHRLIQSVLDCASNSIIIKDLEHRYVFVNYYFAERVNRPKQEIVGKTAVDLGVSLEHLRGDNTDSNLGHWTLDEEVIRSGKTRVTNDEVFCDSDGTVKRMRTIRQPLFDRDGVVRLLMIQIIDMSRQFSVERELHSQHKFFQAVLDCNPNLIYVLNNAGKFVFANQALATFVGAQPEQLFSQTKPEQTILDKITDLIHPNINALLDVEGTSRQSEIVLSNANDDNRVLHRFEQSLSVYTDEPDHVIGVYTDITDLTSVKESYIGDQQQLNTRNAFLSALKSFTLNLVNKMELQPLLQHIADELIRLFNAHSVFVSMVHESRDYIEMVASSGKLFEGQTIRHTKGEGMVGAAWETEKIQIIDDYKRFDGKMLGYEEINQCLAIPFTLGKEVGGVVGVTYDVELDNVKNYLDLIELFAQIISVAVENAKLMEAKNQEIKRNIAMNRLSQVMFSNTDLDTVLQEIVKTVVEIVDAKQSGVFRVSNKQMFLMSYFRAKAYDHEPDMAIPTDAETLRGTTLQWCLENRQIAVVKRLTTDPRETPAVNRLRKRLKLGATVTVPLEHDANVWGVLTVHRDEAQANFNDGEINLVKTIGNQASLILHRHGLIEKIQHQAFHDSLTSLPNRFQFESSLKIATEKSAANNQELALVFLDLDGFKSVNDTLGHAIGDQLLIQVANRLRNCVKNTDNLARMGGDEFAVLLIDSQSENKATRVAERILESLRAQFDVEGIRLQIGASVGISYFPRDGVSAEELLKNADIAMYQAKGMGKDRYHQFSQDLAKKYQKRIQTELDLKHAVDRGELEVYYQPQICTRTRTVSGVEALVRWQHPNQGMISPGEFIPIAEESGLITEIGDWVLKNACQQTVQWQQYQVPELRVAVNISSQQFALPNFVQSVKAALAECGLDASYLELEVTESFVMKDIKRVAEKLQQLRDFGVEISVDDFGTGYSSLMYLAELPLDKLKIDQSFIRRIGKSTSSTSIAKTIILIADSLHLETVAEGIETEEQLRFVERLGSGHCQGYFFSPPVPASELPDVVKSINARAKRPVAVELKDAV